MRVIIPDCELENNDDYQRWWFEVQRAEWEEEERTEQQENKDGNVLDMFQKRDSNITL